LRVWQHDQQPEYTLTSLPTCPNNWDQLRDTNDAQYELTIRGEPTPYEEVKGAYNRLRLRTIELIEHAEDDPELRSALFEAAIKKREKPN
jgi:hypothetical protein